MKILVLNGPNLNLLGTREPEVYGTDTLEDIQKNLQSIASKKATSIEFYQSNSENELIDLLIFDFMFIFYIFIKKFYFF